jgi:hypothetical protein
MHSIAELEHEMGALDGAEETETSRIFQCFRCEYVRQVDRTLRSRHKVLVARAVTKTWMQVALWGIACNKKLLTYHPRDRPRGRGNRSQEHRVRLVCQNGTRCCVFDRSTLSLQLLLVAHRAICVCPFRRLYVESLVTYDNLDPCVVLRFASTAQVDARKVRV